MIYLNGTYIEDAEAKISVKDRGYLFGDGVYEVIRVYKGKPFLFAEHNRRLKRNLNELGIAFDAIDKLEQAARTLIEKENLSDADALIYMQVTRGESPVRSHLSHHLELRPNAFVMIQPFTPNEKAMTDGIRVNTVSDIRWMRCDIKTTLLLPNTMAAERAKKNGGDEGLLIRNGVVTEGTKSNFFGVKDGVIHTHPKSNLILPGITRDLAIEIIKENGFAFEAFPIKEQDVETLDEAFTTGTSGDITPVTNINGTFLGNGKMGTITQKLQKAFKDKVHKFINQS